MVSVRLVCVRFKLNHGLGYLVIGESEENDESELLEVFEENHASKMAEKLGTVDINQEVKNKIISALFKFIQSPLDIDLGVIDVTFFDYVLIKGIFIETK